MDLCFLKNLQGRATTRTLVKAIVDAIDGGMLNSGERLPSSREIASITSTSRTTVVRAFDELIARGYLTGKKGQATFVGKNCALRAALSFAPDMQQNPPVREQRTETFSGTLPANLLPVREWQRCVSHQTTKVLESVGNHSDLTFLKQAICGFLRRTEGILVSPANLFVFTGTDSALSAAAKMVAGSGLACENKNSPAFKHFERFGANVVELSIDSGGIRVDALGTCAQELNWLYVSPTGSHPNGIVLSNERRYGLLEWARIHSVNIIENATGSEFQYSAQNTPSLYSQDRCGSVICYRSLSALLKPLVNFEFLVVPDPLLQTFSAVYSETCAAPLIEHLALAEFINDGTLEKHIRAIWKILRRRRQALIFELKQSFDNKVEIFSSHAGTHIIAKFNGGWNSSEILKTAQVAGLVIEMNDITGNDSEQQSEFAIDFSRLPEENTKTAIAAFNAGLQQSLDHNLEQSFHPQPTLNCWLPQVGIYPQAPVVWETAKAPTVS